MPVHMTFVILRDDAGLFVDKLLQFEGVDALQLNSHVPKAKYPLALDINTVEVVLNLAAGVASSLLYDALKRFAKKLGDIVRNDGVRIEIVRTESTTIDLVGLDKETAARVLGKELLAALTEHKHPD